MTEVLSPQEIDDLIAAISACDRHPKAMLSSPPYIGRDGVVQVLSNEDKYAYIFDIATETWHKLSRIEARNLPDFVKKAVRAAGEV
jgi:hypothetical protein